MFAVLLEKRIFRDEDSKQLRYRVNLHPDASVADAKRLVLDAFGV